MDKEKKNKKLVSDQGPINIGETQGEVKNKKKK